MKYRALYECDTCNVTSEIMWNLNNVGAYLRPDEIPDSHSCLDDCEGTQILTGITEEH